MNKKYTVKVDDNFHFMDTSYRTSTGPTFSTYNKAEEYATKIVEDFLVDVYTKNMSAASLFQAWLDYGEDPFIEGPKSGNFSASDYAKKRSKEIAVSNNVVDKEK